MEKQNRSTKLSMHPYMSLAKSLDVGVKYNTYCLKGNEMDKEMIHLKIILFLIKI